MTVSVFGMCVRGVWVVGVAGLAALLGCEDPDPDPIGVGGDPDPVEVQSFSDVGNTGTGSDLRVVFEEPTSGAAAGAHRVAVVRRADGIPTAAGVAGLAADAYVEVPAASGVHRVWLDADLRDSGGRAIEDGTPYTVVVASLPVGNGQPVLAVGPDLTLKQEDVVVTLTDPIDAGAGGLDVDGQGRIYTGDFGPVINQADGDRVYRVDPADGTVEVFAEGLVGASGNTFDATGSLLQANVGLGTLVRIDAQGAVQPFASGFFAPIGVTVAPGGDVYVNNCGANLISRVDGAGGTSVFAASPLFRCPNGLARGDDGTLYVSNFGDGAVLRVDVNGAVTELATVPGGANAHLLWADGGLYVVGRTVPRIYRLELDGTLTPIAGSGSRGDEDGPALEATLSLPNDLALSPDGSILYFNDVPGGRPSTGAVAPTVIRYVSFARRSSP